MKHLLLNLVHSVVDLPINLGKYHVNKMLYICHLKPLHLIRYMGYSKFPYLFPSKKYLHTVRPELSHFQALDNHKVLLYHRNRRKTSYGIYFQFLWRYSNNRHRHKFQNRINRHLYLH